MMPRRHLSVLIVSDDQELTDLIRGSLQDWAGTKNITQNIYTAMSVAEAWKAVDTGSNRRINLVVARLDVPSSESSGRIAEKYCGLKFFRQARDRNKLTSAIILAEHLNLRNLPSIDNCEIIKIDDKLIGNLTFALDNVFCRETLKESRRFADIAIILDSRRPSYSITFYKNKLPTRWDPTNILRDLNMRKIKNLSQGLNYPNDPNWEQLFAGVGWAWRDELFRDEGLNESFQMAVGFVDLDLTKVRIRFYVEEDSYPLALESLYDSRWEWYMLKTAITRYLPVPTWQKPLFWGEDTIEREKKIRLLLIQSPFEGYLTDRPGARRLPKLTHLKKECDAILDIAERYPDALEVLHIYPMASDVRAAASMSERVEGLLRGHEAPSDHYDIVHFAGHTLVDEGGAFLVFPGTGVGADLVRVAEFSRWLKEREVRLVYLSSCSSAAPLFAYQLARHGVPAILGFHWDVDDAGAAEYARAFYDYIFRKERSLERALVEACNKTKNRPEDSKIWAAPIMILQSFDRDDLS